MPFFELTISVHSNEVVKTLNLPINFQFLAADVQFRHCGNGNNALNFVEVKTE